MKRVALLLMLCLAANGDDLVGVAKASKEKRKKSTTRVITNADVKKSKGKIASTNVPDTPVKPEPTMTEKFEAEKAAKRINDEKRAAAEKLIGELEKELATIEQSYYDEDDLTKRDTEIVNRFNEVKAKLDKARAELAQAAP